MEWKSQINPTLRRCTDGIAKCPVRTGAKGIEGLSTQLEFDTEVELRDILDKRRGETAEHQLDVLVNGIGTADRSVELFETETERFELQHWDLRARDVVCDCS
jgi:hypothetical protein